MKEGLIALESCGGSVDVVTGEFILHVSIGGIIMRGELVGLTFPYILRGNVLQTLNCISEIGNDLEFKHTKCIRMVKKSKFHLDAQQLDWKIKMCIANRKGKNE